jgi:hypothetical protein
MKRLQLHNLISACLASILLWIVFFIPLNTPEIAPAAAPPFDQAQARSINSDLRSARPTKTPTLEMDLPDTSSQSSAELADKLTAKPDSSAEENVTDLYNFVTQVSNNQQNVIRGVYVPSLFSLPVIQQPKNNPIFVSNKHDRMTQFQSAARNGVTGLLAHNYLAGSLFYKLVPGNKILIVYGDGAIQRYQVVSIHRFQKLNPASLHSRLVDLSTGKEFSTAEVFRRFYRGEHHVTFQTCLERGSRLDWGFLFVVAVPLLEKITD